MLASLSAYLDWPDRLTRLGRGPDRRAFRAAFPGAHLFVASIPPDAGGGLDADTFTADELLEAIEESATRLSGETEFRPYCFEDGGRLVAPAFTRQRHGQAFVGEYCKALHRVVPFWLLGVSGRDLAEWATAAGAAVALNPGTRHESIVGVEELALILG